MIITVFGLGEAGGLIAADLASAGMEVHAYDPADVATPAGVTRHLEPDEAVANTGLVLALTAAADAPAALTQALHAMPSGIVYADFSTSSAGSKRSLASIAARRDLLFVDVALMSTVPGKGVRTPALVSGPGAEHFAAILAPLGAAVEAIGGQPGDAATRKLLRSVVLKGLAALLNESLRAAEAAGLAAETWENLVGQFEEMDEGFLRRLLSGTAAHGERRLHEMEATRQLLVDLGIDPVMTQSTVEALRRVVTSPDPLLAVPPTVRSRGRTEHEDPDDGGQFGDQAAT